MEWMERLTYLDFVLLAILGASVLASLIRGFMRELAGLAALIAGLLLALWFHGALASALAQYIPSPEVARMVGFGIIFLGVVILGGFVGSMAAKVLQVTGLSMFDRLAGAVFGIVKGCLFCAVILLAMLAFNPGGPPDALSKSLVAPYVMWSADLLAALAPAEVKASVARNARTIERAWEEHAPDLNWPGSGAAGNNAEPPAPPTKRPARKPASTSQ